MLSLEATGATIGIVAGEASGDQLGAHFIRALRERFPGLRFAGIGGAKMVAAGLDSLFPMEKLAVRGYVEVMRHYSEIVGIRRRLIEYFLKFPPACFVGVDAPDFNLDLELRLRSRGIPTVQYVSPQIWAWRGWRIHKIKRAVSKMLTLFPFETGIYERAGIPVACVGHPLADILGGHPGMQAARERLGLPAAARVVALLPGSRVSELRHMADLFAGAAARIAERLPDLTFIAPLANEETRVLFEAALRRVDAPGPKVWIFTGRAHDAIAAADVVLVASGTATLEAALLLRPMVITYRMPRVSWWIMSSLSYQPFAGLPNILSGERVVPEYIQDDATPDNLAREVLDLMHDEAARARIQARFAHLLQELRQNTGERIVEALQPVLQGRLA
jgi:lipid-A-disaccharide synthase